MYAGILPYYIDSNNVTWLLLGRERRSDYRDSLKWGGFGGIVEKGESLVDAAAREGYEESMGMIGNERQLRDSLAEHRSYPRDSRFSRHYLLRLSHKDNSLPIYFDRMYRYAHQSALASNKPLAGVDAGWWEKCEIGWFKLADVRSMRREMRPAFLRDMRKIPDEMFQT